MRGASRCNATTTKPRSGERMQPTAQAVGLRGNARSPVGAKEQNPSGAQRFWEGHGFSRAVNGAL